MTRVWWIPRDELVALAGEVRAGRCVPEYVGDCTPQSTLDPPEYVLRPAGARDWRIRLACRLGSWRGIDTLDSGDGEHVEQPALDADPVLLEAWEAVETAFRPSGESEAWRIWRIGLHVPHCDRCGRTDRRPDGIRRLDDGRPCCRSCQP